MTVEYNVAKSQPAFILKLFYVLEFCLDFDSIWFAGGCGFKERNRQIWRQEN